LRQKKKKKAIRAALWFNNLNFDEYLTRPEPEAAESRDTTAESSAVAIESGASESMENKDENKTEGTAPGPLTPANMKEKHYQMQLRIFSAFEQMQICKRSVQCPQHNTNVSLDARPTAYSPLFAPFNELRNDLLIMFELQKLVAEKSYELQCVREQRKIVQHEQQSLLTQDESDLTVHMTDN